MLKIFVGRVLYLIHSETVRQMETSIKPSSLICG